MLIFPSGSEGALNIYDALKHNLHFEVFGCSGKRDYTDFLYPEEMYCYGDEKLYITHPFFKETFSKLLKDLRVDYVIPTFDDVALKLAELAPLLSAKVITSPYETALLASDKRRMYQAVYGYSFCPKIFQDKEEIEQYPVFVKPAIGSGSKGAKLIRKEEELEKYCKEEKDIVICENLSGEEISVDCFTDKYGALRFIGPRVRERIWNGIAFRSSNIPISEEIRDIAETLNRIMVFRGAWFFQIKRNAEGAFKLLEFSVRQSTNSSFYGKLGVNLSALSLFDAMGMDVSILCNDFPIRQECRLQASYHLDIAYENVYVDFDDTLTVCNKVNVNMMKLLYQFSNHGKKIILITRHQGDLLIDLKKYKISTELFDEIIWIKDDTPKYQYIVPEQAIFIDNYYKERLEVKQHHNIPVFDVDAAESLIENFL